MSETNLANHISVSYSYPIGNAYPAINYTWFPWNGNSMGGFWGGWGQRPHGYGFIMGWANNANSNNPEDNGAFDWPSTWTRYYYSCQFGESVLGI
jgi:hypothetical protein